MLLERFILSKLSKSFSMCMLVTAVLIGRLIVHRISVRHHTHRTQGGVVEEATLWQCVAEFDPLATAFKQHRFIEEYSWVNLSISFQAFHNT